MPLNVIVIPADPTEPVRAVEAPTDMEDPNFAQWCRDTVGGYLELHRPRSFPRSGILFWCNEDAKSQRLDPNIRATQLALLIPHDFIAGDVVLTGSNGPETADCPLELEQIDIMLNAMRFPPSGD